MIFVRFAALALMLVYSQAAFAETYEEKLFSAELDVKRACKRHDDLVEIFSSLATRKYELTKEYEVENARSSDAILSTAARLKVKKVITGEQLESLISGETLPDQIAQPEVWKLL